MQLVSWPELAATVGDTGATKRRRAISEREKEAAGDVATVRSVKAFQLGIVGNFSKADKKETV